MAPGRQVITTQKSPIDEELLQEIPALLFTDSRSDLAAVIQSRELQNI
jgi:hypothetical protein